VTRDGRWVYFPEPFIHKLGVVDTRTYSFSQLSIGLPSGNANYPSADVSPNGRYVYLGDANVYVVDITLKRIVHTITNGNAGSAHSAVVSPDGSLLFENSLAQSPLHNGILAIDTTTYAVKNRFTVPNGLGSIAVSGDGRFLYETTWTKKMAGISVVDASTGAVVAHVPFKGFPNDIALDDTLKQVYVANDAGTTSPKGQVVVIDLSSQKVVKIIDDQAGPAYLGIDGRSHDVYSADCCLPDPGVTKILPHTFQKFKYSWRLFPGDPRALVISQ
jgi:hypothetical protein